MRIATLTWYSGNNYGSTMQAYALQETLTRLGHETEILSYSPSLQQKLKFKRSYLIDPKNKGIHAKQAREFKRLYGDMEIDKNKQYVLKLLCGYDQSFMIRLKLAFSNKLKSYNWKMTAYFKLAILLNRW